MISSPPPLPPPPLQKKKNASLAPMVAEVKILKRETNRRTASYICLELMPSPFTLGTINQESAKYRFNHESLIIPTPPIIIVIRFLNNLRKFRLLLPKMISFSYRCEWNLLLPWIARVTFVVICFLSCWTLIFYIDRQSLICHTVLVTNWLFVGWLRLDSLAPSYGATPHITLIGTRAVEQVSILRRTTILNRLTNIRRSVDDFKR